MKTIWIILVLAVMLTGCGSQAVFETLGNVLAEPGITVARQISMTLPNEAAIQSMSGETGKLYLCEGYEIMAETLPGGDLGATIRSISGFEQEDLTMLKTQRGDVLSYECAWSSAGEGGDQVSRAVILDDGYYHYCVTFSAAAEEAGSLQEQWKKIIETITVE